MKTLRISNVRLLGIGGIALGLIVLTLAYAGMSGVASAQSGTSTPVISNISATTSETTAHIRWTTDDPATSRVVYGTTTDYSDYTSPNLALVEDHSVFLTNLEPDTLYHYRVISSFSTTSTTTDLTSTSTDQTFTTDEKDDHDDWMDLEWLKEQVKDLLKRIGILEDRVDDLENDNDNGNGDGDGDNGNGDNDAFIEQDGLTVTPGQHVDFAGKDFGSEESVVIERDGSNIGRTAFTNLAGSFTTGSIVMPTEEGTYTFTFTGQESGEVAEADITVEE